MPPFIEKLHSSDPYPQPMLIINLISLVIALLILYLGYDAVVQNNKNHFDNSRRQLTSLVELVCENISRSISSTRDSMRLLTRMPVMRECGFTGALTPLIDDLTRGAALLRLPEEELKSICFNFFQKTEDLYFYFEIAQAAVRRVSWQLDLPLFADQTDRLEDVGISPSIMANLTSSLIFDVNDYFVDQLEMMLIICARGSRIVDTAFSLGMQSVVDPREVGRLLNVSLNDKDLIKSISVKSLDGRELVKATEMNSTGGFWGSANKFTKMGAWPFYPGPVWFDEGLGRPLWQASMPLRDLARKPFAILSTEVDLEFFQGLSEKSRISSSSYLLIVDEEGTVISHPKYSMVANQVNVSHSNPAVKEVLKGNSGFREIQWGSSSFFAAFRNLKSLDPSGLPGWGVLFITPTNDVSLGMGKQIFNVLMWVFFAFFMLYIVHDFIMTSFEEE